MALVRMPGWGPVSVMKNLARDWKIGVIALAIFALDQLTKLLVLRFMDFQTEKVILHGFFKFVHWGNTGRPTACSRAAT